MNVYRLMIHYAMLFILAMILVEHYIWRILLDGTWRYIIKILAKNSKNCLGMI